MSRDEKYFLNLVFGGSPDVFVSLDPPRIDALALYRSLLSVRKKCEDKELCLQLKLRDLETAIVESVDPNTVSLLKPKDRIDTPIVDRLIDFLERLMTNHEGFRAAAGAMQEAAGIVEGDVRSGEPDGKAAREAVSRRPVKYYYDWSAFVVPDADTDMSANSPKYQPIVSGHGTRTSGAENVPRDNPFAQTLPPSNTGREDRPPTKLQRTSSATAMDAVQRPASPKHGVSGVKLSAAALKYLEQGGSTSRGKCAVHRKKEDCTKAKGCKYTRGACYEEGMVPPMLGGAYYRNVQGDLVTSGAGLRSYECSEGDWVPGVGCELSGIKELRAYLSDSKNRISGPMKKYPKGTIHLSRRGFGVDKKTYPKDLFHPVDNMRSSLV